MTMKKKNVGYQLLESEGSSLQEPVASYQQEDLYVNAKVAIGCRIAVYNRSVKE